MLTHFDVDVVQDLPLIPLAMDSPLLLQHLVFRHSTTGCMCKEDGRSHCSHPWPPFQRQQIAAETGWKIILGEATCWSCFLRERSCTEICRDFQHTLVFYPHQRSALGDRQEQEDIESQKCLGWKGP